MPSGVEHKDLTSQALADKRALPSDASRRCALVLDANRVRDGDRAPPLMPSGVEHNSAGTMPKNIRQCPPSDVLGR